MVLLPELMMQNEVLPNINGLRHLGINAIILPVTIWPCDVAAKAHIRDASLIHRCSSCLS